jgi:hypothetical protein
MSGGSLLAFNELIILTNELIILTKVQKALKVIKNICQLETPHSRGKERPNEAMD